LVCEHKGNKIKLIIKGKWLSYIQLIKNDTRKMTNKNKQMQCTYSISSNHSTR